MLQILDCKILKGCLTKHGKEVLDVLAEKQICLDGKKLRGHSPQSRGNAPENLATLRKLALQIVSQHDDKLSLNKRRVRAAYDINYRKSLFK